MLHCNAALEQPNTVHFPSHFLIVFQIILLITLGSQKKKSSVTSQKYIHNKNSSVFPEIMLLARWFNWTVFN